MANINPEIVFEMPFLILCDADVDFLRRELQLKTYFIKEALSTIKRVEVVRKKEFAAAALDSKHKIYVVHIGLVSSNALSSFSPLELDVYSFRRFQVSGLIVKEDSTKIPAEYSDFADIFSSDLTSELSEHTGINNHVIELVDG